LSSYGALPLGILDADGILNAAYNRPQVSTVAQALRHRAFSGNELIASP
jgi:hypothetical protein